MLYCLTIGSKATRSTDLSGSETSKSVSQNEPLLKVSW
jgi:hypothetical protein